MSSSRFPVSLPESTNSSISLPMSYRGDMAAIDTKNPFHLLFGKASRRPSDLELAHLIAVVADERSARLLPVVGWLIWQSPVATAQLRRLWREAETNGTALQEGATALYSALQLSGDLEELITAGDGWNEPAEILDPTGERGVDRGALINAAEAALAQDPGRAPELETVLARLRGLALHSA